jgi:hypothetical protein
MRVAVQIRGLDVDDVDLQGHGGIVVVRVAEIADGARVAVGDGADRRCGMKSRVGGRGTRGRLRLHAGCSRLPYDAMQETSARKARVTILEGLT